MSDFTDQQIRQGMRRLRGEIATPVGFPRDLRDHLLERGLVRFHEWPSGHWQITDKGRNWLLGHPADDL
jgi:hypothetical protein